MTTAGGHGWGLLLLYAAIDIISLRYRELTQRLSDGHSSRHTLAELTGCIAS